MVCPECGSDNYTCSEQFNYIGYTIGDDLNCNDCGYHKFIPSK